ncbi:hypothetical protein ECANGB1_1596 [Enterospora canceri]|uniref:Uncharacterized protein n=1 Tax=Enterospora canceri TaxID=1081671 RepID=A0A1Y1S6U7_9MICR|nr:hypothetical protein ECANGB1_1596 [Enterospora canceri]
MESSSLGIVPVEGGGYQFETKNETEIVYEGRKYVIPGRMRVEAIDRAMTVRKSIRSSTLISKYGRYGLCRTVDGIRMEFGYELGGIRMVCNKDMIKLINIGDKRIISVESGLFYNDTRHLRIFTTYFDTGLEWINVESDTNLISRGDISAYVNQIGSGIVVILGISVLIFIGWLYYKGTKWVE